MSTLQYQAETAGLHVSVIPRFMPEASNVERDRYVWSYEITIQNRSPDTVQLLARYWRITDQAGSTQEVRGPGVVGETPTIAPGDSYSYTSACPLSTPSGVMLGAYQMRRVRDNQSFEIAVPAFALESPHAKRLAN